MERQRKKLFAMMTLVVSHLDRVDAVHSVLRELGRRHVGYGIPVELYDAFVRTFLETLHESLPGDWDPTLSDSWRVALTQICDVMIASSSPGSVQHESPESQELQVLMAISGRPEISGAHTQLFTSFLAKRLHDHDLELARDVQRTLLPRELPSPQGYTFEALYQPAREVGGDYYDCIELSDGRVCIAFGDVAGKGVPAAIVMSRLASAVEAIVRSENDLGRVMAELNDHMSRRAWGGRFVTLLLLLLDPATHRIQIGNAGHRAPFVRGRDGRLEDFAAEIAGVPVGVMSGSRYEIAERTLEPGELVVLFTDGIDEARSPDGTHYGIDRVKRFLASAATEPSLARALLDEIGRYSAGRPPSDDIAILTIARPTIH